MLSERLGRWHFWLLVVGFNLTFLTMHGRECSECLGGSYTYPADRGWEMWNLRHDARSAAADRRGPDLRGERRRLAAARERAGDDPWTRGPSNGRRTSPPPEYNFETIPVTASRRPLWDMKHPDDPDGPHE